jgi:hypothetical protein
VGEEKACSHLGEQASINKKKTFSALKRLCIQKCVIKPKAAYGDKDFCPCPPNVNFYGQILKLVYKSSARLCESCWMKLMGIRFAGNAAKNTSRDGAAERSTAQSYTRPKEMQLLAAPHDISRVIISSYSLKNRIVRTNSGCSRSCWMKERRSCPCSAWLVLDLVNGIRVVTQCLVPH